MAPNSYSVVGLAGARVDVDLKIAYADMQEAQRLFERLDGLVRFWRFDAPSLTEVADMIGDRNGPRTGPLLHE